jgi:hypothetical protein
MDPSDYNPWRQTANNISTVLMQLPALRAQAADARARQQYYGANAQESMARGRYYDAQAADLARGPQDAAALGEYFKQVILAGKTGGDVAGPLANAAQAVAAFARNHPSETVKAFGQMKQMAVADSNDPVNTYASNMGILPGDAVTQEDWRAKHVAPVTLGDNEQLVSRTGEVLNPGVHRVGMGDSLFGPLDTTLQLGQGPQGMTPPDKFIAASPGSGIVNAGSGNIAGMIPPAATKPTVDPAAEIIAKSLGEALSRMAEDPTATNEVAALKAQIRATFGQGGGGGAGTTIDPAPVLEKREIGKMYITPKGGPNGGPGVFFWSGQGWLPAPGVTLTPAPAQ